MRRVVVYPDAATVAHAAAARLLTVVADTLAVQDHAHVVLTGGTVGIGTLEAAAQSPLKDGIDWTAVHVWWGDERFVERGHPDRNEGQAQEALLHALPLPEENIHRMGAADEYESVEAAAAAYAQQIADAGTPAWDVLMLGLGPDAHVASLFPGHAGFTGSVSDAAIAVHDSPKPPPTRVSLSLASLQHARRVWVVAAGAGKAKAVRDCLRGDDLPGATARGTDETVWMIDAAASTLA